ncbi:MAG: phospholipase [Proteobacteria bacterium]|nr:phospholipase [Pseudomonadota bacterium]
MVNPKIFDNINLENCDESFLQGLDFFCSELLSTLSGLESAMRQFHPPWLPNIHKALLPYYDRLREARNVYRRKRPPLGFEPFTSQLEKAADHTFTSIQLFTEPAEPKMAVRQIMRAMRQHYRAQESFFPLRRLLGPVSRYFLESPVRERFKEFDPSPPSGMEVGLFTNADLDHDSRSEYWLYVPETYDGSSDRPLIVALHGGRGNGRDFLWLWMREARSRGFLLLAPSSIGDTWSFRGDEDAAALISTVEFISEKWRVDPDRILLTGFSDGAIYTLTCGLRINSPFTALAPISGVLHPIDLSCAEGKPIYLVHGSLDWMFKVQFAHQSYAVLKQAGTEIVFREIENLSHTYPREENDRILAWFDPALAL